MEVYANAVKEGQLCSLIGSIIIHWAYSMIAILLVRAMVTPVAALMQTSWADPEGGGGGGRGSGSPPGKIKLLYVHWNYGADPLLRYRRAGITESARVAYTHKYAVV